MADRAECLAREIDALRAARKKSRSPYLRRDLAKAIAKKERQLAKLDKKEVAP